MQALDLEPEGSWVDKNQHKAALSALRSKQLPISDLVVHLVGLYEDAYGTDAYEINCGLCEDFAHDLVWALGEDPYSHSCPIEIRWHDEMEDCTEEEANTWAHCFVVYQGRYYDSQAPEGVDAWRELPCFRS